MLIVFEGPSRSGKSTLAKILVERLGDSCVYLSHPTPEARAIIGTSDIERMKAGKIADIPKNELVTIFNQSLRQIEE